MKYPFHSIEAKWQKHWLENQTFASAQLHQIRNKKKPKYYVLDMFPYPSGAGLHVGHPEGYTATDIIARYKRMLGYQVMHPMGWDAFGLPAERYAQKTGIDPAESSQTNINNFRRQLQSLGFSYDWQREINTTNPKYYRWTQWIFVQFFNSYYDKKKDSARPIKELSIPKDIQENSQEKEEFINSHRLAYIAKRPVNWCPELGTVLANEEIEEWSEKGFQVIQKPMRQWMLRITDYAHRLLKDLDLVNWPRGTIELQKNWIGKSEGAVINFPVVITRKKEEIKTPTTPNDLEVFTTRPDTLFGVTFIVLAPEHPMVKALTTEEQEECVSKFILLTSKKITLSRVKKNNQPKGIFLGSYAVHPFTKQMLPIWIADYILMDYGSGAIMGVPAHDKRDFLFAQLYKLPIRQVIQVNQDKKDKNPPMPHEVFSGFGVCINSDFLTGLPSIVAQKKIISKLEEEKKGKRKVQFKLRDWVFSRQRYWGEPIPISSDKNKSLVVEDKLPLILPKPKKFTMVDGQSPLAHNKKWINHQNEQGKKLIRETNTMPQWAGSCWYYLRFLDPRNDDKIIDPKAEKYWMDEQGVDLYVGGQEHATLHLLYARFWHKFLYDIKVVSGKEPFYRLVHQGVIFGEDGRKMSKSLGNVINPDLVVEKYGADALRLFEMFLGPLEQDKRWSSKGIEGISRFLNRIWRLYTKGNKLDPTLIEESNESEHKKEDILFHTHRLVCNVTKDIEKLSFNTAISHLMVFVNFAIQNQKRIGRKSSEIFLLLLSPFAPHLAEELWSLLGHNKSLAYEKWPDYDERYSQQRQQIIVLQINGKLRGRETIDSNQEMTNKELEELAKKNRQVKVYLETNRLKILKCIIVKDKLVNFVCQKDTKH